jgi:hypothetical protein
VKTHISEPAITVVLAVKHVYLGLGYTTGQAPKPDGFFSLAVLVAPLQAWGWVILACGVPTMVALIVPPIVSAVLNLVAAVPMAVFSVFLLASEFLGRAPRFGSAVLFVIPVVLHLLLAASYRRTARDIPLVSPRKA